MSFDKEKFEEITPEFYQTEEKPVEDPVEDLLDELSQKFVDTLIDKMMDFLKVLVGVG